MPPSPPPLFFPPSHLPASPLSLNHNHSVTCLGLLLAASSSRNDWLLDDKGTARLEESGQIGHTFGSVMGRVLGERNDGVDRGRRDGWKVLGAWKGGSEEMWVLTLRAGGHS